MAMKLCPCGYLGDKTNQCSCSASQIKQYESRLSGPLLDRIDLHLSVPALPFQEMSSREKGESSLTIRERVVAARQIQKQRFLKKDHMFNNSQMGTKEIETHCDLDSVSLKLLEKSVERLRLSARAYHRILKIARTIADMDKSEKIGQSHIAEAVQYRRMAVNSI